METPPKARSRRTTPLGSSRRLQNSAAAAAAAVKPAHASNFLGALRATTMMNSKIALPAEILDLVLDHLPVADLLRCARASKRMQEMVYDDTRWVRRLQLMGCWDERQARRKQEESMLRKLEGQNGSQNTANGGRVHHGSSRQEKTLFDAGWEAQTALRPVIEVNGARQVDPVGTAQSIQLERLGRDDALSVMDSVRSIRGSARKEYGKVHRALQPYYVDMAKATIFSASSVYSTLPKAEDQAKVLANLRKFSKADTTVGHEERQEHLETIVQRFEDAAARDFETGCRLKDYDGSMRQNAHVLVTLNGGTTAIDYFITEGRLMKLKEDLGSPMLCLEGCAPGHTDIEPSRKFFYRIAAGLEEESMLIERVFPENVDVFTPLLGRIEDTIISEYMTTLFNEAHALSSESYLKAVAGVAGQAVDFAKSLSPPAASADGFKGQALQMVKRLFDPHIELFMQDNFKFFKEKSQGEVELWSRQLSEKEASAESFYMSHVSRQAAKQDFLSSFKKVFMMPVNAFPTGSKSSKAASSTEGSRSATPDVSSNRQLQTLTNREAPTTELAAQTAIINSKLEGIGGLLSLEVSLTLVHAAKAALERAASFIPLGVNYSDDAKEQCQNIFVELLIILGTEHIQLGFDKAIDALSRYNAREATEHGSSGVRPLVMFLELVNVGDLIQQMVEVFFVQELVTPKIVDRDDFLSPSNKSKKKFEQTLDESVAAGLNKGIDVLMDEVEFVCATTQTTADFNPNTALASKKSSNRESALVMDIGPTATCKQIVELVSTHTDMLVGSTDKNMLDVFNQEVGLRLFTALCKHMKRQRISSQGAIKLISDTNHYFEYVQRLKNKELLRYFMALRELSQIFLVDGSHGKEIATIIADGDRYHGIFRAEEVYEFAQRRADWYMIRSNVERAMYGVGCRVM